MIQLLVSRRSTSTPSWRDLAVLALIFSSLTLSGWSATSQRTIDDTNGDPFTGEQFVYAPIAVDSSSPWQLGQNCGSCRTHSTIDTSRLYGGSWHDTTSVRPNAAPSTASISFTGTAVWVQAVIPGREHSELAGIDSEYYFFINDTLVGMYTNPAPSIGGDGYNYNTTVYSNTTLPLGKHSLTLRVGHDGGSEVLMLLDSVIYTFDDGPDAASSTNKDEHSTSKKQWIIIAAAIPTVVGVLAIIGVVLYFRRRHQRRYSLTIGTESDFTPYKIAPAPDPFGSMASVSTAPTNIPRHGQKANPHLQSAQASNTSNGRTFLSATPPSSDSDNSSAPRSQAYGTIPNPHDSEDDLPPPAYGAQRGYAPLPGGGMRREKRDRTAPS